VQEPPVLNKPASPRTPPRTPATPSDPDGGPRATGGRRTGSAGLWRGRACWVQRRQWGEHSVERHLPTQRPAKFPSWARGCRSRVWRTESWPR